MKTESEIRKHLENLEKLQEQKKRPTRTGQIQALYWVLGVHDKLNEGVIHSESGGSAIE